MTWSRVSSWETWAPPLQVKYRMRDETQPAFLNNLMPLLPPHEVQVPPGLGSHTQPENGHHQRDQPIPRERSSGTFSGVSARRKLSRFIQQVMGRARSGFEENVI